MKINVFFKTKHEIFGMDRQQADHLKFKIDGVVWRCPCCWCMFRPRCTSKKIVFFVNLITWVRTTKVFGLIDFAQVLFFPPQSRANSESMVNFKRDCFFVVSTFFWERVVKGGVAKRVILGFFEEECSKQDDTPYKSQEHHRQSCYCRQCLFF